MQNYNKINTASAKFQKRSFPFKNRLLSGGIPGKVNNRYGSIKAGK
jgi:hypothetical protein